METQLLVLIGDEWRSLDLSDIIPISVTIQQLDITDFSKIRSPYSKTFTIPATQNNNKIFENYYEVNGTEFNPYSKLQCVVTNRGKIIFDGFLRLNAVITNPTFREYEVFILSPVSNFASELKELQLQDLDYSDLQHTLEYSAVTLSWEAKSDTSDGLFGGDIIYPLINYGLLYPDNTGTTPSFSYSFTGDTGIYLSGNSLQPTIMKPAIRLKSIVDRLFDATTYSYESDFFDTDYFKSIYMDTFTNGKLGIEAVSAVTNENKFKVYTNSTNTIFPIFQATGDLQIIPINWRTEFPDGYDPLNNFSLGITNTPVAPTYEAYFRVPFPGVYGFNVRFNYSNPIPYLQNRFYIIANKGNDLATLANEPSFALAGPFVSPSDGTELSANILFTGDCSAGEYIKLFILVDPSSAPLGQIRLTPYDFGGITEAAPTWELYAGPEFPTEDFVDITQGIANMSAEEFFKSLVKMFNLIVVENGSSSSLKIEPFNWYFNDPDRAEKDWTPIMDLNSQYRLEPLGFDLLKEQIFTYTDPDLEQLGFDFEAKKDYVFGRYKFVSEGDILTGENTYELPYRSVLTNSLDGAPNIIIPEFYKLEAGRQEPYSNKPHIFFWVGNRYAYTDAAKTIPGYWWLSSGATPVQQTTYPCVSHFSTLDIQVPNLISDLNYSFDIDQFSNANTNIVQNTPFTLYNTFWNDYISNTYSPETKRLTARFFFQPLDAYETRLTDKIFVKDSQYMIEKITDADLVSDKLVEVSLIKERGGYDKVIPPAPVYALSGNTPYPSFQPVFNTLCYYSTDGDVVCDGTAPVQLLYSFGPGDFVAYQKVYYDTGVSLALLPVGTYFRSTASAQRWIVIDTQGRIIQADC